MPGRGSWGGTKPPMGVALRPSHPLCQGLAGYWPFLEGSGTRAANLALPTSSPAVLTGGVTQSPLSRNRALKFDGTSGYLNAGQVGNFTTTNFSLFAWIYPLSMASERIIFWKGPFGGTGYYFSHTNNAHTGALFVATNNTSSPTSETAQNVLVTNAWQHVGVVINGASAIFYVNGHRVNTATAGSMIAPGSSTNDLFIGQYSGVGEFFDGAIDSPMIWNRSLTDAEVAMLYAGPYDIFAPMPWQVRVAPVVAGTTPGGNTRRAVHARLRPRKLPRLAQRWRVQGFP